MKRLVVLGVLAACGADSDDILGPFTGERHRYYVDRVDVPRDNAQALAVAADLDGDGAVENQFGNVTGVLAGTNDLASLSDSDDMIKAGFITSIIEVQTDGGDDPTVGVTYHVTDAANDMTVAFGGSFAGGHFISNRTATTSHPGTATVLIPVYTNTDPLMLKIEAAELELTQDASGYAAILRGVLREELARSAAFNGLIQMFQDEPERHLVFSRGIDTNHDGVVSRDEVDASVINLLVKADVDMFDGDKLARHPGSQDNDSISVAFAFHVTEASPRGTPANHCRDRMRDGDETDVDCGGSCQKCWDLHTCMVPEDCQSNSCGELRNGEGPVCAVASCTDNVRDAFESDVDCGGPCGGCAQGKVCAGDTDCASHNCDNGPTSLGQCQ